VVWEGKCPEKSVAARWASVAAEGGHLWQQGGHDAATGCSCRKYICHHTEVWQAKLQTVASLEQPAAKALRGAICRRAQPFGAQVKPL